MSDHEIVLPRWRLEIRNYKDVTENNKTDYIEKVLESGRLQASSEAIGLSYHTIKSCMSDDIEFAQAVSAARDMYRDRTVGAMEEQAAKGTLRESFGKDGNVVKSETVYETPMRVLMMKSLDPKTYTPTSIVDIQSGGKPLGIVPATASMDEWESMAEKLNDPDVSDAEWEDAVKENQKDDD